jgi:hypothetical protein
VENKLGPENVNNAPQHRGANRSVTFWAILGLAIAVVVVVTGYVIVVAIEASKLTKLTPEQEACTRFLGNNSSIGVTFSAEANAPKFEIGDTQNRAPVTETKIIDRITECLVKTGQLAIVMPKDFERIRGKITLGSLLDNFENAGDASTSKLNVSLQPSQDEQLNNLIVPANAGPRWGVVKSWCEDPPLNACLKCSAVVNENTTSITISKKVDAPFAKQDEGPAGGPPLGKGARPIWELVELGHRMTFSCGSEP